MEIPRVSYESSEEIDYMYIGETIDSINDGLNNGRGISAIRDVSYALKAGEVESAKATIKNEWDKISSYPEVADYLIQQGLFAPVDFSKYFDD